MQYNDVTFQSIEILVAMLLAAQSCLSHFRNQQILTRLQHVDPSVASVTAHFVLLLEGEDLVASQEIIDRLLQTTGRDVEGTLIVPRIGTISPWSSKATDILRNCGVSGLSRVERGEAWQFFDAAGKPIRPSNALLAEVFDPMTSEVLASPNDYSQVFSHAQPQPFSRIELGNDGVEALAQANRDLGLALGDDEIEYLVTKYNELGRDPVDAELMMFAQANSEHCRHKIFNASWTIDGEDQPLSLFAMIRNTYKVSGDNVLSAYSDNASVTKGPVVDRLWVSPDGDEYGYKNEPVHMLMKVETHNHPTAIAPHPGAGTGSGGEIRDEGAVGRGSKPKVGLTGFSVSNLRIPGFTQPWEVDFGKPERICSAFEIMQEGPIGGAAFNNEFGRPNINGYFRTYEQRFDTNLDSEVRGYHKPIMIAGGYGNVRDEHVLSQPGKVGMKLVVIGGPAMEIGLGGGAASSVNSGAQSEALDFASVQRQNPEMERRAQEVIDRCCALGEENPIALIHDVGAGGLSNAFPELVDDLGVGGDFELRKIPSDEPGMTPLAVWCNESQERYVMAIHPERMARFESICERERCPYSAVGTAIEARHLTVSDSHFNEAPVDLPLEVLLGKTPKLHRDVQTKQVTTSALDFTGVELGEAIKRVLSLPTVASKSFLITIGDRSITGQVVRDQMVGPWQVPVADYGMTTVGYNTYAGEAMSMGERAPVALISGAAAARLSITEVITNLAGTSIGQLSDIKLSANWMCAAGHNREDQALFEAVKTVGMEFCPELGLTVPVGKDSLSMRTQWKDGQEDKAVVAPLSLVVSGFTPVEDVRNAVTPQLQSSDSTLLLLDLGRGKDRLAASALAQVFNQVGDIVPDVSSADVKTLFNTVQGLLKAGLLRSYHDRSDGGLITTLAEMAFAGRIGWSVNIDADDLLAGLFSEEAGAVLEVASKDMPAVMALVEQSGATELLVELGTTRGDDQLEVCHQGNRVSKVSLYEWQATWAETSYRMQALRDNPECAAAEFEALKSPSRGIRAELSFDLSELTAPAVIGKTKPKVAILREQGVNGQNEMAAAFDRAGFQAIDVHMSDILSGRVSLSEMSGLAACGGFSYGDVLGAGRGWASTILNNSRAYDEFSAFFQNEQSFSLGVCNGCQMMAQLQELIPGSEHWPTFHRNASEQFEARVAMVEVMDSPSILLSGMAGTRIPVAVAHGEGQAKFASQLALQNVTRSLRYIDDSDNATEQYPLNPNGSPEGITGVTSLDGRATIMMPHPERVFRTITNSHKPAGWEENGAWMKMFLNARKFIG
ncbi:phosphoribosylformylglycinamidine synthase [Umboniibacter marinipuniceus]|uniref:Phosphoribosylformylglycinamidine synthase n=1 Tax=Umboniibacter marinipuniceus TaxID=569599 RepID=A0A3M0AF82_9GAMM|nr:phosphoribosylformylglycinamidine synthase [Umboniibacter marinipuniceus]RMA81418.1 phosphoribosylformylglycinamidine synthase [Umboniibacter marinipuniceus]